LTPEQAQEEVDLQTSLNSLKAESQKLQTEKQTLNA